MAEAHDRPGEPPEVRDEAADTPMWVPAVGLALLILGAVFLVWQSSSEEAIEAIEETVEAPGGAAAGEAETAEEAEEAEEAADPHAGHGH